EVDRFLVRDIDSVVNVKERVAVDAWLASDRYFHVLRDFISHTELILAGMWGGVGGVFPDLNEVLSYFKPRQKPTETFDQLFLREVVWPSIKASVLQHDSCFDALGAEPYPPFGNLPPDKHIGQNEAAVR
ncbi:MAG: tetratricopeptide repeat protein, partial [Verrucomicrobiota bacterium]